MAEDFIIKLVKKLKRKKRKNELIVLSKPYVKPTNTYKYLICTRGFGHSGSGVINDLLAEFDNTTLYCGHDINGGSPLALDNTIPKIEVDFLRRYGGVFNLEHAFIEPSSYSFVYILNFINLIEFLFKTSSNHFYNDKFVELTNDFISNITESRSKSEYPLAGQPAFTFSKGRFGDYKNLQNPFVYDEKKRERYSYKIKNLTISEYRSEAQKYIKNVFNLLESKDYLVLDQLLSDGTENFERYHDYVGDYKQIAVYRDPRDVYMTGILLNELWIPRDKVDFVNWFNKHCIKRYLASNSSYVKIFRFEDLVLDYDNTIPKVIEFLGLKKENHVAPKTQFRPEYSKKNIGLYKNHYDQDSIKYIEEHLKEFCYYG